ncbi:hypothetical protein ACEPPN_000874 [Leptodophora sp. 'Broadleaf-Isolate-01']
MCMVTGIPSTCPVEMKRPVNLGLNPYRSKAGIILRLFVRTALEDYLACFTADRGDERYSGVLIGGTVGPARLTRVFAIEQREGKVYLCDAARKTAPPDETTDFAGECAEFGK